MPVDPPWKRCAVDGHPLCPECYQIAINDGLVEGTPTAATSLKTCNKCKQAKTLDMFGPKAHSRDGLQYTCKRCLADIAYERNKAKRAAK